MSPRHGGGSRLGPAALACLVGAVLAVSACGCGVPATGGESVDDAADGVRVVATTAVLGDLTRTVVGDQGSVTILVEAGQDPHTFQLSARQVAELRDVDLLVVNGLGLEAGLADAIDQAATDGIPVLTVGTSLDPVPAGPHEPDGDEDGGDDHGGGDHDEGAEDDHDHGPHDPHVWLDVDRMTAVPGLVADALDDVAEGDWHTRADRLADELESLDGEVAATVSAIPDACRQVATGHDELGYFARRYGLEVPVTVIPGTSTEADPSARDFAAGIDTVRASGLPSVVVDEAASSRLAEAFADDAGVTVVALPLAGPSPDGSGSQGYVAMMHAIADGLAEALATCPAATDK